MSEGGTLPEASGAFEVRNALGMHARAAARLAHLAETFDAEVQVERAGERVCAKSIMGLLLLCGQRGTRLQVFARGPDAQEAVDAIGALIASGFGEQT